MRSRVAPGAYPDMLKHCESAVEDFMRWVTLMFCATLAPPLAAQEGERPANWRVRFDRADAQDADLRFVTMTPGWHITTGPAGIFYDPHRTAEGNFRVESEIFFLDPGRRQREAYGVVFGGRDLSSDDLAYVYFLIRNDGRYLIKRRAGSETANITTWTEHSAIVRAFQQSYRIIDRVGAETNALVVDPTEIMNGESELFADHVHTTPAGSEELASIVAAALAAAEAPFQVPTQPQVR